MKRLMINILKWAFLFIFVTATAFAFLTVRKLGNTFHGLSFRERAVTL